MVLFKPTNQNTDDVPFEISDLQNKQELNCNTKMNKKLVRLTESDLHRIVKESVNQWFKDMDDIVDEAYKPLGAKYSDEHISEVTNAFHRQIANLLRFMNAYSDTILSNNVLDEDSYDRLFNQLAEIDSHAH